MQKNNSRQSHRIKIIFIIGLLLTLTAIGSYFLSDDLIYLQVTEVNRFNFFPL